MKKSTVVLLLLSISLLRVAAAANPEGNRTDTQFAAIPQRMQDFVAQRQVSGVVTLVADVDHILHQSAVGEADVSSHAPMREDSLFSIASMTKPITATAVMILVDEGKLSIDDPASKYIPELAHVALKEGPPDRAITIRDLLTHTSGVVGDQQNQGTLEETAIAMAKRPLGFQPRTKWQYSPGLSICGRIIEVASGCAYDQFLNERIFRPLQMNDTTFFPSATQQQRLVKLYKPSDDKKALVPGTHWLLDFSEKRTANPSGGLFSTAADMARFYQMILSGGAWKGRRIVSAAAVREMTTVQTGDLSAGFTPGCGWGLGWGVVRDPQGVTAMLSPGTFGHGGAFGTQGWVDPQKGLIFVLMIQRTGFGNGDASEIRRDFQHLAVRGHGK